MYDHSVAAELLTMYTTLSQGQGQELCHWLQAFRASHWPFGGYETIWAGSMALAYHSSATSCCEYAGIAFCDSDRVERRSSQKKAICEVRSVRLNPLLLVLVVADEGEVNVHLLQHSGHGEFL